jgi:CBS domain containing-hemolysin-like protein
VSGTDIILIASAVVISALCSGLEIAFVSGNKLYIELERKRGALWAKVVARLQKRPGRLIGALLVGNNIALVVYGVLMAKVLEPWLVELGMGEAVVLATQTLISTLVILVLAEFLPKAVFRIDPNGALRVFALPLQVLYMVLWAPTLVMTGLSEGILRLLGLRTQPGEVVLGRVELGEFLRQVASQKTSERNLDAEVEYFRNTLELSNTKVRDRMVPRARIEAIDVESTMAELHERFVTTGVSKLLVYKDGIDNIIGYVHGHDLFRKPRSIRAILRPVRFVPGTMPADEVLQLFIKDRAQLVVVVDEFGGTAGMVTVEDLVETIVGEIEDEHDVPEDVEEKLGDHTYLFSARLHVADLRHRHHLALPENEAYDTLAGLVLYATGEMPEDGQVIEQPPFRYTIAQVEGSRIALVRIEVTDPDQGYLR